MRDRFGRAPGLLLALILPVLAVTMLPGCGGGDAPEQELPADEPLKLGDDSPLDQLNPGADPGQG